MKVIVAFCLLWLVGSHVEAQSTAQRKRDITPLIWLKPGATNAGTSGFLDYSENNYSLLLDSSGIVPDSIGFNFNPAFSFANNTASFVIPQSNVLSKGITVFVVMQADTPNHERSIYNIRAVDSSFVRVTTRHLVDHRTTIPIADSAITGAIINVISKQFGKNRLGRPEVRITLGSDSLSRFEGKIAEFLLFDERMRAADRARVESYLALKYGVTLPTSNYISGKDSILWNFKINQNFQHGIAAIGADSTFQLNQKQSAAQGGSDMLVISAGKLAESNQNNNSILTDGNFLVWGHSQDGIELYRDTVGIDSLIFELRRTWKMIVTGDSVRTMVTQVVLDGNEFVSLTDPYLKIWSGDATDRNQHRLVFPDSIDTHHRYYFSNIKWDEDGEGYDYFTFGFQTDFNQPVLENGMSSITGNTLNSQARTSSSETTTTNGKLITKVFPNPSSGEYTVQISANPDEILHAICIDMFGKILYSRELKGAASYTINDFKVAAGQYALIVSSTSGLLHSVNRIIIY